MLSRTRRTVTTVSTICAVIAALCLLALAVGITFSAVFRALTGRDIPGIVEGAQLVLVASAFLGMGWAYRTGSHVRLDLVTERMTTRARTVTDLVMHLVLAAILAWMIKATTATALASLARGEYQYGTIPFPIWPARLIIPIGLTVMLLEVATDILNGVLTVTRRDANVLPDVDGSKDAEAAGGREVPTIHGGL